jgi:hypothetical protein
VLKALNKGLLDELLSVLAKFGRFHRHEEAIQEVLGVPLLLLLPFLLVFLLVQHAKVFPKKLSPAPFDGEVREIHKRYTAEPLA